VNDELFEKITGVSSLFWKYVIKKMPKKAQVKIEIEAKQISKNGNFEIRITGVSHPVPKDLSSEMKSMINTLNSDVLVLCGGVNLIPNDAKSVVYVDDNEVNCILAKGQVKEVIYTKDVMKTLGELKMKFDCAIMNPPYGKLHLPILKKMVEEIVDRNDGRIISIQPMRWVQEDWKNEKNLTDFLKDKCVIKPRVKAGDNSTFGAYMNIDLGIFHVEKNLKDNLEEIRFTSHGIDYRCFKDFLYSVKNTFPKLTKYKDAKGDCIPISLIVAGNGNSDIKCYSNIVRSKYGYIKGGICSETNKSLKESKTSHWGDFNEWPVIETDHPEELYYYMNLRSFKFLCSMTIVDVNVHIDLLPYTKVDHIWTEDEFRSFWGWTKEMSDLCDEVTKDW
jgi:hypothetical protein